MSPEEYKAYGLTPPQVISHQVVDEELHKKFEKSNEHKWFQQGSMIKCKCMGNEHGTAIPTNKILKGTDGKGLPILEDVI